MARPVNRGIRLDYFICSEDMIGSVRHVGSDAVEANSEDVSEARTLPLPLLEEFPIPGIHDSYMLHSDTVGISDHCPVTLVVCVSL